MRREKQSAAIQPHSTPPSLRLGNRLPRPQLRLVALEELRISLFAQQLGTSGPVSVKRIQARWKELGL